MAQVDIQLGHKIKLKRRKLGITQADLSKKLSISPSYLNLIEGGKRKIGSRLYVSTSNFNTIPVEVVDTSFIDPKNERMLL